MHTDDADHAYLNEYIHTRVQTLNTYIISYLRTYNRTVDTICTYAYAIIHGQKESEFQCPKNDLENS